jgi:NAD(P)-dependent dehydrogenase (short-subunit alcohol dehydrogenase family)
MSRLNGKIAVVTGGGSGIGLGAAKRFVEEGAFVYIFGRRQAQLEAALAQLGANARAVQGSVTDPADLDRLYETVKAGHGRVDIVFANAGTGSFAPLGEITPEHYDSIFDVNVKGLLFTVQKALPLMSAGGSIILTGSSTSVMGTPQFSVYSATKAAIRNLARSWALDLQGTGIRINVLSPGPTKTELALEVVGEDAFQALGAATPLGRLADPSETAAVAAFLASSDSSYMTGGEVFVDGGLAQV